MRFGIVYMHYCSLNGKSYIGQTVLSMKDRIKTGYKCGKFGNAIKKHGWKNFETRILGTYHTNKLNDAEQLWILIYKSVKTGYNISPGGQCGGFRLKKVCTNCNLEINLPAFNNHFQACCKRIACPCGKKLYDGRKEFCSNVCKKEFSINQNRKISVVQECCVCGKQFMLEKRSYQRKTCSDICLSLLTGRISSGSMKDTWERRTDPQSRQLGEHHPRSKLTEDDVLTIRKLLELGKSQTEIANSFNVGQAAIWKIKNKRSWTHVSPSEVFDPYKD